MQGEWRRRHGSVRRLRAGIDPAGALIEEAEAFLAGEIAERWVRDGHAVPGWAWLNALAHGSEAQVRAMRWLPSDCPATERTWCEAIAFVANVLCALASTDDRSIAEVQRRVLVPLELRASLRPLLSPGRLVQLVVDALQRAGLG